MPRLFLLLAIALAVYILFRRAQSLPPHKRRGEYIKLALGVTVVIVIIATLTGRMHWVGAAFTGLLVAVRQFAPLLVRLFPLLATHIGSRSAQAAGQTSTVETALLRMELDHDTGALEGEVLEGQFKDWRLADLDKAQLQSLHAYCQQDADSLQLLESYLEQRFPGDTSFGSSNHSTAQSAPEGPMNRAQALAVLGLEDGASEEEIVAAHRKLMQKMHPDRGGSDYLAAKINQAKDFLLGS